MCRSGDRVRFRFEVERPAQVYDHHFFAGIELELQFLRRDAVNAQLANEPLAPDKFPGDPSSQRGRRSTSSPIPSRAAWRATKSSWLLNA